jgi:hypothetical protein
MLAMKGYLAVMGMGFLLGFRYARRSILACVEITRERCRFEAFQRRKLECKPIRHPFREFALARP